MDAQSIAHNRRTRVWLGPDSGDVETFRTQISQQTLASDWPLASEVVKNLLVYQGSNVRAVAQDSTARWELMAEWAEALERGPGAIVIRDAVETDVVDEATNLFEHMIAEGAGGGDHFAKPGANDRVWNAVQKHCIAGPANFARYYGSDVIYMAAEAWLGRGFQMTAQVNRVNPGGAAQTAHRDYHLGFMAPHQMAGFPAQMHRISPLLTLQGAVAHCDMPLETGPTMLLPYSQIFFEGYIAFHRPEFQQAFADHHVQLPLAKGDALFFNPALMHGAGTNVTKDIRRMANLLQVSSAFGVAMERMDRPAMCKALYPALLEGVKTGAFDLHVAHNALASCAEGYAFPTNLDTDPPVGGLAPKTQATLMQEGLEARQSASAFADALDAMEQRRLP